MGKVEFCGLILIAIAALPAGAQSITCNPPSHATCNPCAIAQALANRASSAILDLEPPISTMGSSAPDVVDANGPFTLDDSGDTLYVNVTGDGIGDIASQLKMLEYLMDQNWSSNTHPGLGTAVTAAFIANEATIEAKMGDDVLPLFRLISPSFVPALTFYSLLGTEIDGLVVTNEDPIVAHGHGATGLIALLFQLLDGRELNGIPLELTDPTVSPGDFITFGHLVGAEADFDGDGYSNLCEYRHFKPMKCNAAFSNTPPFVNGEINYFSAVLDPEIVPVGCYEELPIYCEVPLTADLAVHPTETESIGGAQIRVFENTETQDARVQVDYFHNLAVENPVAVLGTGAAGEAGTALLTASGPPLFGKFYLDAAAAELVQAGPTFLQIAGDAEHAIRGDNLETCPAQEGEGGEAEGIAEAEGAAEGEGVAEGAEGEGTVDGEGAPEGEGHVEAEGGAEAEAEGAIEAEGDLEGELGEGEAEDNGREAEDSGDGEGFTEAEGESDGEGELTPPQQAADADNDFTISLPELLHVVQFYNFGAFSCGSGDGEAYLAGGSDYSCRAHDTDYNPQDWTISLSELLRLVQFYSSSGYERCSGTEDLLCAV